MYAQRHTAVRNGSREEVSAATRWRRTSRELNYIGVQEESRYKRSLGRGGGGGGEGGGRLHLGLCDDGTDVDHLVGTHSLVQAQGFTPSPCRDPTLASRRRASLCSSRMCQVTPH